MNLYNSSSHKPVNLSESSLFLDIFYCKNIPCAVRKSKNKWYKYPAAMMFILLILLVWITVAESPERKFNIPVKSASSKKMADSNGASYKTQNLTNAVSTLNKEWMSKVNLRLFADAHSFLDQIEQAPNPPSELLKAVSALRWATDLESYIHEQNPETPVIIFRDEDRIKSIISRWEAGKHDIYPMLYYAAVEMFGKKHAEFLHKISDDLRTIYGYKNQYIEAIENLKISIETELDAGRFPTSLIDDFKQKYPGAGGVNLLEEDLANYIKIDRMLKTEPLAAVVEFMKKIQFHTALMAEKADRLLTVQAQMQLHKSDASVPKINLMPITKRK